MVAERSGVYRASPPPLGCCKHHGPQARTRAARTWSRPQSGILSQGFASRQCELDANGVGGMTCRTEQPSHYPGDAVLDTSSHLRPILFNMVVESDGPGRSEGNDRLAQYRRTPFWIRYRARSPRFLTNRNPVGLPSRAAAIEGEPRLNLVVPTRGTVEIEEGFATVSTNRVIRADNATRSEISSTLSAEPSNLVAGAVRHNRDSVDFPNYLPSSPCPFHIYPEGHGYCGTLNSQRVRLSVGRNSKQCQDKTRQDKARQDSRAVSRSLPERVRYCIGGGPSKKKTCRDVTPTALDRQGIRRDSAKGPGRAARAPRRDVRVADSLRGQLRGCRWLRVVRPPRSSLAPMERAAKRRSARSSKCWSLRPGGPAITPPCDPCRRTHDGCHTGPTTQAAATQVLLRRAAGPAGGVAAGRLEQEHATLNSARISRRINHIQHHSSNSPPPPPKPPAQQSDPRGHFT